MKKTIIGLVTLIVINSVAFALSPTELIKLRTEWDTKLRETTEKIANNPPEFELHYFNEVIPRELSEENYKNETIMLDVEIPYIKQIKGLENFKIVSNTLNDLQGITESKKWGEKINGFPWTYAEDIKYDNWLKKAINRHVDRYNFIIELVYENNKIIAKKPITYMICYAKRYNNFVAVSDYDIDGFITFTIDIKKLNIKNFDTNKLSIKVENVANSMAILPAEKYTVTYGLLWDKSNKGNLGSGYYKVVGQEPNESSIYDDIKTGSSVFLDCSLCYDKGIFSYITTNEEINSDFRIDEYDYGEDKKVVYIMPGSPQELSEALLELYYQSTPEGRAIKEAERREEEKRKAEAERLAEEERKIKAEKKLAEEKKAEAERLAKLEAEKKAEEERIEKERKERIKMLIGENGETKIEQVRILIRDKLKKDSTFFEISLQDTIYYILASEKELSSEKDSIALTFEDIQSEEDLIQLGNVIQIARIPIVIYIYNTTKISIPENCFYNCENLVNLFIYEVSTVHENAFNNCPNLFHIQFSIIEELQPNAFKDCPELDTIALPKKIKNQIKNTYKDYIKEKKISFL